MFLLGEEVIAVVIMLATAYCSCASCCAPYDDGITAMGTEVEEGRTIAGPPEWPLGTKVYIEGMGVYTVEDRGGAIKGNRIDVFMDCHNRALQFGRRRERVWILEWGKKK